MNIQSNVDEFRLNQIANNKWSERYLREFVIDMKSGLSRSLSHEDIGIPVLRSNNIDRNIVNFNDLKYWYVNDPQGANVENYFLKNGDLLVNFINSVAQIGKVAIFNNTIGRNVIYTTNVLKMTLSSELNSTYFLHYSQSNRYKKYISMITKPAVNQASFTTKEFRNMKMLVPPIEEQQKIAIILSTWDSAIELKEKLIEQKKEQKKGLMQKLLMGQIRWNDREKNTEEEIRERLEMIMRGEVPTGYKDTKVGILPEEWTVERLKKISKRVQRKNEGKDEYPVLTISSLGGFLNQSDRFSKVIAGENLSKYTLLKKYEFAYNKGNSKTYPYGCIFRLEDYNEALIPNVYYSFQITEGDTEFYKHYFISGKMNRHLARVINTGVRNDGLLNLDVNDFFDIPVACPPIKEQSKIAKVLSLAVEELQCLEREVDSLREQKKGLMQLLLTGKVRVKV
ncbi:restriction endonuclease subunit S [Brevibacillus formosus]|uniref:restriction endonuclease subunit S n=1 Tax=Brevibacillus formosus TaxID=54913 RepID=UPI003F1C875F